MEALERVMQPVSNIARFYAERIKPDLPQSSDYEVVRDFLFDLDERTRGQTDILARSYAQNRNLSIGDPSAGTALILRSLCAVDTICMINDAKLYGKTPIRFAKCSDAHLIEWLLVAVWRRRADNWMMLSALALSRGEGFYSGVSSSLGF